MSFSVFSIFFANKFLVADALTLANSALLVAASVDVVFAGDDNLLVVVVLFPTVFVVAARAAPAVGPFAVRAVVEVILVVLVFVVVVDATPVVGLAAVGLKID